MNYLAGTFYVISGIAMFFGVGAAILGQTVSYRSLDGTEDLLLGGVASFVIGVLCHICHGVLNTLKVLRNMEWENTEWQNDVFKMLRNMEWQNTSLLDRLPNPASRNDDKAVGAE